MTPAKITLGQSAWSLMAVSWPQVRNRKRGLATPSEPGLSLALVSIPASLRSRSNAPRMSTLSALKVNTMTPSSVYVRDHVAQLTADQPAFHCHLLERPLHRSPATAV